jgi:hypothetical protein
MIGGGTGQDFTIGNLTAQGYDYLGLIRNNEVWEKQKQKLRRKGYQTHWKQSQRLQVFSRAMS